MTDQLTADDLDDVEDGRPVADDGTTPTSNERDRRRLVGKWDRPPDPRDWRFVVGTVGKILIATGVLLFGFVAYQLWGTGLETARAQNALEDQFEQQVVESRTNVANPAGDQAAPDDTATDVVDDEQAPSTADADADTATATDTGRADAPPEVVEQELPPIVRGQALAKLEIPKIGKTSYVVQGVGVDDLQKGPGHYPDTPLPGQLGNAAIAGHRTTWGEPFRNIHRLEPGDEMIVTMANGDVFVYDVTDTEIVQPEDYWVVTTRNPNIAELTLTSCHPIWSTSQRIAVHGILNPERSAAIGVATPYDVDVDAGLASPSTVDDPVLAVDPATLAEPQVGATITDDQDTTTAAPLRDDAVADEFARGWFHDRSALPQFALWGSVLTLIALGAYLVSKRFRRDSMGLLIGVVPFVVVLYFFFQNVNRLLPPGL